MPKYRCVTSNRETAWFATRREALRAAVRLGLTVYDLETGEKALRAGVHIEKRPD